MLLLLLHLLMHSIKMHLPYFLLRSYTTSFLSKKPQLFLLFFLIARSIGVVGSVPDCYWQLGFVERAVL